MGKKKSTPDGLSVHDKTEGGSEEGHAVFAEVCINITIKDKYALAAHRILAGSRRVTRDILVGAMDRAQISPDERERLWERYFGGPPTTIPEFVRRRAIITGGVHAYAEVLRISHETISAIMRQRVVTLDVLALLLSAEAKCLPWQYDEIHIKWRREYEAYLMRRDGVNLLAARIRMVFDMRPAHSLESWMRAEQMPAGLGTSKNRVRKLVGFLRRGSPESWNDIHPILAALGCTEVEIAEVQEAWQQTSSAPSDDSHGSQTLDMPTPTNTTSCVPGSGATINETVRVDAPIDEHVFFETIPDAPTLTGTNRVIVAAEPSSVQPTRRTARRRDAAAFEAAPPKETHSRVAKPTRTMKHRPPLLPPQTAVIDEEPVPQIIERIEYSSPEVRLFGEEDAEAEVLKGMLPDFGRVASVWLLGEYLRNFSARESVGYDSAHAAFTAIAEEVRRKAPLGINDIASMLKMLVYSFGRSPEHPGTDTLIEAISQSIGTIPESVLGTELMTLLAEEPRFKAFLIYYRDTHPTSRVTQFLGTICSLSDLAEDPAFDPDAATDSDRDYASILRPPPEVRTPKVRKSKTGNFSGW